MSFSTAFCVPVGVTLPGPGVPAAVNTLMRRSPIVLRGFKVFANATAMLVALVPVTVKTIGDPFTPGTETCAMVVYPTLPSQRAYNAAQPVSNERS